MPFQSTDACRRHAVEYRTTWLAELSDDELRSLDPWRILTAENARGFLIRAARDALGAYKPVSYTHLTLPTILLV